MDCVGLPGRCHSATSPGLVQSVLLQGVRVCSIVALHESSVVGVEECHVVPAVEDKHLLRLHGLPHRRPEVVEDKRLLRLPGLPHRRPEVVEDKRLLRLPGLPIAGQRLWSSARNLAITLSSPLRSPSRSCRWSIMVPTENN